MLKVNKIILGTVQLGLEYGINNTEGKPNLEKSFNILKEAYALGIRTLDTAEAYGDAHFIIRLFHEQVPFRFKIISKYASKIKTFPSDIAVRLEKHCIDFDVPHLEAYMFHSYDDFKETLQREPMILKKLKNSTFTKKIGVSVYDNNQIEDVLNYEEIKLIQVPFNVFDNDNLRKEILLKAQKKGVEVHTRSVFLQGIFFKDFNNLKGNLVGLKNNLIDLDEIVKKNKSNKIDIALNYAISKEYINKVLIGVDNVDQLKRNIKALETFDDWKALKEIDDKIHISNNELLNPSKWNY